MIIVSWCSLCSYSFIADRVRWAIYFNGKMWRIKAVLLVWYEFGEFVLLLSESINFSKPYRSKSVNGFVKIQFTGTEVFVTEAIYLIFAIRLIELSCWHFNNDRISQRIAISIDNLKINISWVTLGYFASFAKVAVKYWCIGSNRVFFSKNILDNPIINFFIKPLILYFQFIHHSIFARSRNSVMMLQIADLLRHFFK